MKRISLYLLLMSLPLIGTGQEMSYSAIVNQLMSNGPVFQQTLSHARIEAQAPYSGSLLENPEAEAAYYWGDPAAIGHRWDLSISQPFEVPTAYIHKNRMRQLESRIATSNGLIALVEIISETQRLCSDIVYQNALVRLYEESESRTAALAALYEKRMAMGDCSVLDYNRAQLELSTVRNLLASARTLKMELSSQLETLNGGEPLNFQQDSFLIPESLQPGASSRYAYRQFFDSVPQTEHTGELLYYQTARDRDSLNVLIAQDGWLPRFDIGYASENIVGETFRGVTLGFSLPLWNNRGKVNLSRQHSQCSRQDYQNACRRTELTYQTLIRKARLQLENAAALKQNLETYNNLNLLSKALDAGEISLESYLMQADFYNNAALGLLDALHSLDYTIIQLEASDLRIIQDSQN